MAAPQAGRHERQVEDLPGAALPPHGGAAAARQRLRGGHVAGGFVRLVRNGNIYPHFLHLIGGALPIRVARPDCQPPGVTALGATIGGGDKKGAPPVR
eukprot:6716193-Pyramimonas_sp.AAC.1